MGETYGEFERLVCLYPRTSVIFFEKEIKSLNSKETKKINLFETIIEVKCYVDDYNCTFKFLKCGLISLNIDEFIMDNRLDKDQKKDNLLVMLKILGAFISIDGIGCEPSLNDFYVITLDIHNDIMCDSNEYMDCVNAKSIRGKNLVVESIKYNNSLMPYVDDMVPPPAYFLNDTKGPEIHCNDELKKFGLQKMRKLDSNSIINIDYNFMKANFYNELNSGNYLGAGLLLEKLNILLKEIKSFKHNLQSHEKSNETIFENKQREYGREFSKVYFVEFDDNFMDSFDISYQNLLSLETEIINKSKKTDFNIIKISN